MRQPKTAEAIEPKHVQRGALFMEPIHVKMVIIIKPIIKIIVFFILTPFKIIVFYRELVLKQVNIWKSNMFFTYVFLLYSYIQHFKNKNR